MILKIKFKNGEVSYSKNKIVVVFNDNVQVVVDGDVERQNISFDKVESIYLYYEGKVEFIYPK